MSERGDALEDTWYAWEETDAEQSWLLSYVDVLCVILAMVLVLLAGRLESEPAPPPPKAATATSSLPAETLPADPLSAEASPVPGRPPVIESDPVSEPVEEPDRVLAAFPARSESPGFVQHQPLSTSLPPPLPATVPAPAVQDRSVEGVAILHDEQGMTLQIAEVVLFESGQARLKESAGPVLERALMLLRTFGDVDVAVQGHTDNRPVQGGPFGSNWALAAARANAVATYLLASGQPPERLRLESYADTRPIADNTSAAGRARNRRVELRVELTRQVDDRNQPSTGQRL